MKLGVLSALLTRINRRSGLRQIVANSSWLFADRLFALIAGFLVGAWVARYLGPSQYGQFNYALAFCALFVPIAGLGLANIVVRELVRTPKDKDAILGTATVLQFAASLLAFVLLIVTAYLLHPADALTRSLIPIIGLGMVFQSLGNTVDYSFQAQLQSKYIVWSRNIALLLIVSIQVALILAKAPLIAFAWLALAQIVFYTIGAISSYHLSGQKIITWRFKTLCVPRLLRDSWPLLFSGLAIVVYMRIDLLMLERMVGEEALGVYSAAVRLSELWYFLPVALATSVFPAIVRSRENQTEQVYQDRLQLFYDVSALVAYCVVIPCAILASPLVLLFFGPAYAEAGPILTVRIWAFIFVSLGIARNQWLFAENRIRFALASTVLGGIVNIGMNLVLIPLYGGLGAAWATLISQAIAAYLSTLLLARRSPVFTQLSLSLLVPFRLVSLWKNASRI